MKRLCVSIGSSTFKKAKVFFEKYDFLELRQDLLKYSKTELIELFSINQNCILTLKDNYVDVDHIKVGIESNIKFIDIPIDQDINYDINSFPQTDTSLILSFHGESRELRSKIKELKNYKFDVLKIATVAFDQSIVETIEILENELNVKVVYIPMGEEFQEIRYSSLLEGQIFTFVYPDGEKNTAAGQLPYEEAINLFENTDNYAVVGNPISHSKSPSLFNPFRSINSHYSRIRADKFSELKLLIEDLNLTAFNVTSPFKLEAYLEWGSENQDLEILKNVNTVYKVNGEFQAANTDVDGFEYATTDLVDINKSYLIIGAGSTARTIVYSLKKLGFKKITICNRTFQKAIDIANEFECNAIEFNTGLSKISEFDHSISTISSKLSQEVEMNVNYKDGNNLFAAEWLEGQAIKAFELMGLNRKEIKINPNRKGVKNNIVFIGFMGSGKTSFAKEIAESLEIPNIDLDELIEIKTGKKIENLIKTENGKVNDSEFRLIESKTFSEIKEEKVIISVGGGFVDDINNLSLLKNSFVIYLYSPFNEIKARIDGTNRPLLKLSDEELNSLFEKRKNKYFSFSDLIILNGEFLKTKEALIEEINNTGIFKRHD